ncbi:hypothetical protein [Chromobacterium alticapitis]|uniref:Uncharacterized protein n=1 Tax=Chromobacterium alticapitis TaxID=2073169 RepID=A0A2S5DD09_9NEIS|nr:hypothetical protein [Chromobacterium alticapitis]POZ60980.1 hypothetical protein C2I19_16000 [Chromobacterium alticapitis]
MMQGMPSYDRAPPPSLPLPFLLAAPVWLGLAGAALLLADGGAPQRFDPALLAAAHLLALGVLGNAMCGAALQILAVVAGVSYTRPRRLLHGLFWPLQLGCGALALAFLNGFSRPAFLAAGICLAWTLLGLASLGLAGLWRSPARDASSRGIAAALACLILVVALGLTLAGTVADSWPLPWLRLLNLHILFALGGWLLGLIMAVAITVVPMFQITPAYPARWQRFAAATWLAALALAAIGLWLECWPLTLPACALATAFAWHTGRLQARSRRPQDIGRRFWQCAMAALVLALAAALAQLAGWDAEGLPEAAGWLALFGLGGGAVLGMWYKILPFLLWLDLQKRAPRGRRAPSTLQLLPESAHSRCLALYLIALGLGTAAAAGGAPTAAPAIALLALAACWAWDGSAAMRRYRACRRAWTDSPAQLGAATP